jgi:hypothetical protein
MKIVLVLSPLVFLILTYLTYRFVTRPKTVNVRDFGAAGDGVMDDTAAFNRALAELERTSDLRRPKVIFFPRGTYLVNGTARGSGKTKGEE